MPIGERVTPGHARKRALSRVSCSSRCSSSFGAGDRRQGTRFHCPPMPCLSTQDSRQTVQWMRHRGKLERNHGTGCSDCCGWRLSVDNNPGAAAESLKSVAEEARHHSLNRRLPSKSPDIRAADIRRRQWRPEPRWGLYLGAMTLKQRRATTVKRRQSFTPELLRSLVHCV